MMTDHEEILAMLLTLTLGPPVVWELGQTVLGAPAFFALMIAIHGRILAGREKPWQ